MAAEGDSGLGTKNMRPEWCDVESMAYKVKGAAIRRQRTISFIAFLLIFASLSVALFSEGLLQKIALEVGLLVLVVKAGFYIHYQTKFNHIMFWVHLSFERRLMDIHTDLMRMQRIQDE
jgi:hypothetical protein